MTTVQMLPPAGLRISKISPPFFRLSGILTFFLQKIKRLAQLRQPLVQY